VTGHRFSGRFRDDGERRQAFLAAAALLLAAAIALSLLHAPQHHPAASTPAPASTPTAPAAPAPPAPAAAAPASTATPPPAPAPRHPPRRQINRTQDRQNQDPRFRARLRQDQQRRPAFQHLPYQGTSIDIQLAGTARDGRLLLTVTYRGSLAHARRSYHRFLARYRDPGRAYQPIYQPAR